jgi:hypothetical protein
MLRIINGIPVHIHNMIIFAIDRIFASSSIARVPTRAICSGKAKKQSLI